MEKAELQQLAARAEQGDSAAWDALYREIGAIAASVCRKYNMSAEDAADVTQEAALALSGRLDTLARMDNPEGYLRRTVNSKCIDLIRADTKVPTERMHENEDYVLSLPDASATPENEVAGFSPDRLIDDFLAELPEDQRVALTMRYCDGYTNAQIAEKLGVPPGTVASRVRYGKKALEKRIVQYEKENHIRLHAKIALPFLPWRWFQHSMLQTAEIIAADGGSSASGVTKAIASALATVVMGGAVISSGLVFHESTPPLPTETAPTQAVTEQAETPEAATVYEDIYETQVETVYETVNVTRYREAEQERQDAPALPDAFRIAGNRFEPSENLLTSNTFHSDVLGATLTFPDSWINNVEIEEEAENNSILLTDRGTSDNPVSDYCTLLAIDRQDCCEGEYREDYEPPQKNEDGTYESYIFTFGVAELPDKDKVSYYRAILNWNSSIMKKTDLDYSNINREVLSVLESFRPDNLTYKSLLTQEIRDAVMEITDFRIATP